MKILVIVLIAGIVLVSGCVAQPPESEQEWPVILTNLTSREIVETQEPEQAWVLSALPKDCHLAFLTETGKINYSTLYRVFYDGSRIMYDGRDIGVTTSLRDLKLSKDNFAFQRADGHVIYNGKDMGEGGYFIELFGDHIVFSRYVEEYEEEREHVIYDGKDVGEGERGGRRGPGIEGDHLAFVRNGHVIYDGRDLGEATLGTFARYIYLSGDHIAFFDPSKNIIYDGKNLGKVDWSMMEPVVILSGDHIAFTRNGSVIYDGNIVGEADKTMVTISGENIAFLKKDGHLIYNGKDLGEASSLPLIEGNHTAFFRQVIDEHHLIYDGKDLGEVRQYALSGDRIAFLDNEKHLIVDGKDWGEVWSFEVSGSHIAAITGDNRAIIVDDKVFVDLSGLAEFGDIDELAFECSD